MSSTDLKPTKRNEMIIIIDITPQSEMFHKLNELSIKNFSKHKWRQASHNVLLPINEAFYLCILYMYLSSTDLLNQICAIKLQWIDTNVLGTESSLTCSHSHFIEWWCVANKCFRDKLDFQLHTSWGGKVFAASTNFTYLLINNLHIIIFILPIKMCKNAHIKNDDKSYRNILYTMTWFN